MKLTAVQLPEPGTLVKDASTGRTGVFMEEWAGVAMLRPEKGGTEWAALPEKITPVEPDEGAAP